MRAAHNRRKGIMVETPATIVHGARLCGNFFSDTMEGFT